MMKSNFTDAASVRLTARSFLDARDVLEYVLWSFYIFSGGGSADELFFRDFDPEFFQEFGGFVHFLA